jgi:hypothetical protein
MGAPNGEEGVCRNMDAPLFLATAVEHRRASAGIQRRNFGGLSREASL